jgi:hypothetical protein
LPSLWCTLKTWIVKKGKKENRSVEAYLELGNGSVEVLKQEEGRAKERRKQVGSDGRSLD